MKMRKRGETREQAQDLQAERDGVRALSPFACPSSQVVGKQWLWE